MLSGRMAEIQYLNQYYDRDGSQILVVYGQKHIGKTTLVRKFAEDRPMFYYLARPCSEREQLHQWQMQLKDGSMQDTEFPGLYDALTAVCEKTGEKKVIIIDEFQHIVKSNAQCIKELVRFLKERKEKAGVMVLLCSSSISWIENSMLVKLGDAAKEISGLLKVRELSFRDMMHHFQNFRMEECVEAYAVLGGIPGLWRQFDDRLSIQQNICRNILNADSFLFEEGERMVTEQLRETSVYDTILATIAAGNHKLNDIYLRTGFSRAKISVYLKNLMELELVEKIYSYDTAGKENTQKGIYRIVHPFVDFYFTYMYPNLSALQTMEAEEYYSRFIAPHFKKYIAGYFKKVCRQHLERLNRSGRLPFRFADNGEWVGKEGNIDIIAQDEEGKTLIALCNWEKPMMTYEDYMWLLSCAQKAKIHADYIYLYAVSRFDEKLNLEAKVKNNLRLVHISDI